MLKKSIVAAAGSLAILGSTAATATAVPTVTHGGPPYFTTLDACGFFVGIQTPITVKTTPHADGTTTTTQHGSWTGVENNYIDTPVVSLGPVSGQYSETVTTDTAGGFSGVENFVSSAGLVTQSFAFDPVANSFTVTVTANKALSFLASDTNGNCYSGPFPRP